jgi:hypothetical protein
MGNETSSFISYFYQNYFREKTITIVGKYGGCRYMEFTIRGINTAFYIFIKLPDLTFINYALPPPIPHAPVCVRYVSDLPTNKYRAG